jgi:FKBP-type peptidyl-prolyl cis-trans isomerase
MNASMQLLAVIITAVSLCACDRPETTVSIPAHPITALSIQDTKTGTGAAALKDHQLTVHYTGWLYDGAASDFHGKQFDSSRGDDNNKPQPFSFYLGAGQVIPGWDQGLVGMQVGGKRTLIIPSELAYGKRGAGRGVIPADAALIFDIELLSVK